MNHTQRFLGHEILYMCKVISALDWTYEGEYDFVYQFFIAIMYT
jgi:hypothetical protein